MGLFSLALLPTLPYAVAQSGETSHALMWAAPSQWVLWLFASVLERVRGVTPCTNRDKSVSVKREVESCTYSTQSAYAEAIDSLARTRKLPSLPTLESRSSALERVMLPWYQHWSIAGAGGNPNANTGAARAACVSVSNNQAASAHQLPVSIVQRGKGNSAADNFLNSNSSESERDMFLQPPLSLLMLQLKWLARPCSLPFPPPSSLNTLYQKVPAGDPFCSPNNSVP